MTIDRDQCDRFWHRTKAFVKYFSSLHFFSKLKKTTTTNNVKRSTTFIGALNVNCSLKLHGCMRPNLLLMRLFFTNVDKKCSVYEQYVLPYSRLVDLTLSTWRLKTDQNMAARPLTVGGSVWLGTIQTLHSVFRIPNNMYDCICTPHTEITSCLS